MADRPSLYRMGYTNRLREKVQRSLAPLRFPGAQYPTARRRYPCRV